MRSPLTGRPLRNPGESGQQRLQDLFDNQVMPYMLAATLASGLALLEWIRWLNESPPTPVVFSMIAVLSILVCGVKLRLAVREARNIKLGRDGEKAVGQFLERLREQGAQIFHDVPGTNFNVDHVVIHGTGVYVIETKTLSKPDRGECRLVYDGQSVRRNGRPFDRNAIDQVRAESHWIGGLLAESTGKKPPVRPVVVYPGWFIDRAAAARSSEVWVLEPKALPAFIAQSRAQMTAQDVKLFSFHLSRYIRSALA